jgi:2-polyprenyl-3-methyl-5-hydroxy-6-metoxy-1,4-benzoquinol methylase
MRPALKAQNALERIAIRLNLAPVPAGEALFEPAAARVLVAGVRLGVFERLAGASMTAPELAAAAGTEPRATELLLESLAGTGHLKRNGAAYTLSKKTRKWLDPASDTYVGTYIDNTGDYGDWWMGLEDVIRTGQGVEIHEFPPGHPHWGRYIRGQFELARLSAGEVASKLRVPDQPRSLLDIAGGHGWYAAALCNKYPGLNARVLDLEASLRVGREIIAEQGMSDRVEHEVGDLFTSDVSGPHDVVLTFNIVHHLDPEQIAELAQRVHAALRPGGTWAVLDYFRPDKGRGSGGHALLGLFFFLTSSASTYRESEIRGWMTDAGFSSTRRVPIRRLPDFQLWEARKAG